MFKYHIQTIELASAQTSFTFSSIPQIYSDLLLVFSVRTDNTNVTYSNTEILLNNSSSNFSSRRIFGDGGTPGSYTATNIAGLVSSAGATSNSFGSTSIYIPNYSGNGNKAYSVDSVSENNSGASYQELISGLWSQTAAITSITIRGESGRSFVQYSSASLYGIKRGSDGKTEVASGGTVTTSGGYTIHTFTGSGTFVANRNLEIDTLVIAGGGGGGADQGGGGGAGGYVSESRLVASGSYLVTVGAGGSGSPANTAGGASGSNSIFLTFDAIGGGRGGNGNSDTALSGGSGGGGGSQTSSQVGKAGTSSQGFAGANGSAPNAGGGGGASEAGNTDGSRTGGDGLSSSITGTSIIRAGGGSGGSNNGSSVGGGDGGGGTGTGNNSNATSGTANTGSGGGGGGSTPGVGNGAGGNGGSGVVIIRYLTPA
jgi:hypothetical protein